MAGCIVVSRELYMRATGGVYPYRRDVGGKPSYYAVCPACDNPIQIVGLFRQQEESRPTRPYGRHHPGSVPGLASYDEDAYLHCPYADPNRAARVRSKRRPDDPLGRRLYATMRDDFDRVVRAWEAFSGIHLGTVFARDMLRVWHADEGWRYYDAWYGNLPQMLFFAAGGRSLVGRYIVRGAPLAGRLEHVPQVRLDPVRPGRYVQVRRSGTAFLDLDFLLHDRCLDRRGEHVEETYRLSILTGAGDGPEPRAACPDLTLAADPDWRSTADRMMHGGRDDRLLDIAREILA